MVVEFLVTFLKDKKMQVQKLEELFNKATDKQISEGMHWYTSARTWSEGIAKKYDVKLEIVVGILAALSPKKRWEQNKDLAEKFIATNGKGNFHFGMIESKARAILALKKLAETENVIPQIINELNGQKIVSFFSNIYYPMSREVTIDVWAARALDWDKIKSPRHYSDMANVYKEFAKKKGIRAYQAQAIIWTVIRGNS